MTKDELLLTFSFESIMAEVAPVRTFSRLASYIDEIQETWGPSVEETQDLIETASRVRDILYEAFQMVDMTLADSGPTVGLLLERDVLNALNAQVHIMVRAKGEATLQHHTPTTEEGLIAMAGFAHALEEVDELAPQLRIDTVSGRGYYRDPLLGLAKKMNVTLKEEDAL